MYLIIVALSGKFSQVSFYSCTEHDSHTEFPFRFIEHLGKTKYVRLFSRYWYKCQGCKKANTIAHFNW